MKNYNCFSDHIVSFILDIYPLKSVSSIPVMLLFNWINKTITSSYMHLQNNTSWQ